MEPYYQAYDKRYTQIHEMGLQWASDNPTPLVGQTIARLGLGPDSTLLELGCGEGRDALALLRQGKNLLATDLSAEAVRYCQARAPEYAEHFAQLDVCREELGRSFDFIYAVAVLHMLVDPADRAAFWRFIRGHLTPTGAALVLSMGDGRREYTGDPSRAFEDQPRIHQATGQKVCIAATSCRIVTEPQLRAEAQAAGLEVEETGLTSLPPDFDCALYALVRLPGCGQG